MERLYCPKPTQKANAGQHSIHAHVYRENRGLIRCAQKFDKHKKQKRNENPIKIHF